jgi:hypothetical protein
MYRPIQPFAGITAPGIPRRGLAWPLHWMPMDFDTGLRTGACALSQHLRVLYTAKVCTTLSVKLLSITRVCAGSIRHGTRTVFKVLSFNSPSRDRVHVGLDSGIVDNSVTTLPTLVVSGRLGREAAAPTEPSALCPYCGRSSAACMCPPAPTSEVAASGGRRGRCRARG